jgi:hypothetical protein
MAGLAVRLEPPRPSCCPIDDKLMILAAHAHAAYPARDPILGQRLWPSRINFVLESTALRAARDTDDMRI